MGIVYKAVEESDRPVIHWRTKGSKNGIRLWQHEDGSYTTAGRNSKPGGRYNQAETHEDGSSVSTTKDNSKHHGSVSDEEYEANYRKSIEKRNAQRANHHGLTSTEWKAVAGIVATGAAAAGVAYLVSKGYTTASAEALCNEIREAIGGVKAKTGSYDNVEKAAERFVDPASGAYYNEEWREATDKLGKNFDMRETMGNFDTEHYTGMDSDSFRKAVEDFDNTDNDIVNKAREKAGEYGIFDADGKIKSDHDYDFEIKVWNQNPHKVEESILDQRVNGSKDYAGEGFERVFDNSTGTWTKVANQTPTRDNEIAIRTNSYVPDASDIQEPSWKASNSYKPYHTGKDFGGDVPTTKYNTEGNYVYTGSNRGKYDYGVSPDGVDPDQATWEYRKNNYR